VSIGLTALFIQGDFGNSRRAFIVVEFVDLKFQKRLILRD
jgi:hypothetical protein